MHASEKMSQIWRDKVDIITNKESRSKIEGMTRTDKQKTKEGGDL